MFEGAKQNWKELKRGKPGSRFEKQYERQRESGKGGAGRWLRTGLGVLLIPAGLFFLPAPGPGMVILAIGALLVAREFRFAARALDWLEVTGRRLLEPLLRRWRSP